MATFKFGVTQEDIEKEEAQRIRELEANVQRRNQIRNQKLEALAKKNKRNRFIVTVVAIIFLLSMITFGTYNTFFKSTLSQDDVSKIVQAETETFNINGVEGFLHESIESVFAERADTAEISQELETCNIDPNSVRVTRILPLDTETAVVYFNANLNLKMKDGTKEDGSGEMVPYTGATTYNKYQFRAIITYKPNKVKEDGTPYDNSYRIYRYASDISMSPIVWNDNYKYEDADEETVYLSFEDIEEEEPNKTAVIQTKVDRIFSDLYEGKNASADFSGGKKFNKTDEYLGISEFKLYTQKNPLGYNAVCTYTVKSTDKITYSNTVYLAIEANGSNNWKITSIL